jgi:excisionase family DNA binding protein
MVMERVTLTVPQTAEALGISKNRAYELCAENLIPHIRLGGRIVIPVAALELWLSQAGKEPKVV